MRVSPYIRAIRAVAAGFALRILKPVAIIGIGVLITLIGLSIWLVTINDWWWILLAFLLFITAFFSIALVIAALLLRALNPPQTKAQRTQVQRFVDTLQKTAETVQTPKFILLFRLIVDVISPSKKGIVSELSHDASSLQKDFKEIIASF